MRPFLVAVLVVLVVGALPAAAHTDGDRTDVMFEPHPSVEPRPFGRTIVFPQEVSVTTYGRTFGMRKPDGRRHAGEDLFAPKGTPVYAVADGVVTAADRGPSAGYYVVVTHAGGWESRYLHLNDDTPGTDDGRGGSEMAFAPGIEVGAFVWAGRLIGYVGDSGNAEGASPHTHFELHRGDQLVDPGPFLGEAFALGWEAIAARRLAELTALVE